MHHGALHAFFAIAAACKELYVCDSERTNVTKYAKFVDVDAKISSQVLAIARLRRRQSSIREGRRWPAVYDTLALVFRFQYMI